MIMKSYFYHIFIYLLLESQCIQWHHFYRIIYALSFYSKSESLFLHPISSSYKKQTKIHFIPLYKIKVKKRIYKWKKCDFNTKAVVDLDFHAHAFLLSRLFQFVAYNQKYFELYIKIRRRTS